MGEHLPRPLAHAMRCLQFGPSKMSVYLSQADFVGDGSVGFSDFPIFALVFGTNDTKCDLDGDGSVGFTDFLLFAFEFGR